VLAGKSQAGELGARLQGGLVEKLIRSSNCPVWCVSDLERFAGQESVRDVLAPLSLEHGSTTITRLARSVAETQGGKVTLLHVVSTDPAALRLNRDLYGFTPDEQVSVTRAQASAEKRLLEIGSGELKGVDHDVVVLVGYELSSTILELESARQPSLIVMGTAGYGGFFHLVLGSAAETVARRAGCSVMTIRVGG
jgi:nucleotide-binding universal stress UspA family protein